MHRNATESLSLWNWEIYFQFLIKMTMTFSFVLLTVVKKYLSPHATITSLSHTRQKSHRSVDVWSWNVGFVSLSILLSGMNHARLMKLKQSQYKQSLDEKHQKLSNCWGLQSKLQLWITFKRCHFLDFLSPFPLLFLFTSSSHSLPGWNWYQPMLVRVTVPEP